MINLEQYGFTKITWDGLVPSPLPTPFVPYWGVEGNGERPSGKLLLSIVWHPNYDGKGSAGFLLLEDVDAYIAIDGKWCWDYTVEDVTDTNGFDFRPYTGATYIKRIPSPLPENLHISFVA
jgi:hypothetical protein